MNRQVGQIVFTLVGLGGCTAGTISGVSFFGTEAPTVNAVPARTRDASTTVTGGKAVDTVAWMQRERDAEATVLSEVPSQTSWSAPFELFEGENTFVVFATNADHSSFSSRVGPFTIVRDTTPPTAPVLDAPTSPTSSSTATLTGTRAADGNLCLRTGQEPTCIEVSAAGSGTTISQAVDLNTGANTFCFSSADDLGNTSPEVCVDVVRIGAPAIVFVRPTEASTIGGASVRVELAITTGPAYDEAVDTVQVCFDGGACQNALLNSGKYETTLTYATLTNDSTHVIAATATNLAGGSSTETITVTYNEGSVGVLSDDSAPGHSQDAALAVGTDGVVHVVWSDECFFFSDCAVAGNGRLPYDIFYRSFNGTTWSAIRLISDDADDADSQKPAVAVDGGGNVHIAWAETGTIASGDNDIAADIAVRVIAASGGALSPTVVVGHTSDDDTAPRLAAAADGTMRLVWERLLASNNNDRDIYYAQWTPSGAGESTGAWGTALLVSDDTNDGRSVHPGIATDSSSNAWIVWQEDGDINGSDPDDDVFLRKVSAAGSLGSMVLVSDYAPQSNSRSPVVAMGPGDVAQIAWIDNAPITDPVFGASGTDNDVWARGYDTMAGTLSAYRLFSDSTAGANTPAIATTGDGTVVVAWTELVSGNGEVFYRAMKGGVAGTDRWVSVGTPALSIQPALVVDANGDLMAVWQDDSTILVADLDRPNTLLDPGPDHDIFWKQFFANDEWATVP